MTSTHLRLFSATIIAALLNLAYAQDAPDEPLVSPSVSPNGGWATFYLNAPHAESVSLIGDWMTERVPQPMRSTNDGLWSVAVRDLSPDFYSYSFIVDGVRTVDPLNPMIKQGISGIENMFLVPGKDVEYALNQPVPHGEIREVWYESSTLGEQRRMHVYTPPGYDDSRRRYPVLYLLHGGGDEDSGWSTIGRAGFILDNLIASGEAVPMLVVMPNGSGLAAGLGASAAPDADPQEIAAAARTIRNERFRRELIENVIAVVENRFRVRANPEDRALAGLSMGGGQTTEVFSRDPDRFAYYGIWSAGLFDQSPDEFAARNESLLASVDDVNDNVQLLSIVVGEDDFVLPGSRALHELFEANGLRHEFTLTGGGHTWLNWRAYLRDFAPRLFR
jgi:enterochelin esterase-like enzyme